MILPDEVWHKIFLHLNVLDLKSVAISSKQARRVVRNKTFGLEWFCLQANNLQAQLQILTEIGSMDELYFGIKNFPETTINWSSGIYLLHLRKNDLNSLPSITLYNINLKSTGKLLLEKIEFALLDTQQVDQCLKFDNQKKTSCELCKSINHKENLFKVSKNYRVFFQNWKDDFSIQFPTGQTLNITLSQRKENQKWREDMQFRAGQAAAKTGNAENIGHFPAMGVQAPWNPSFEKSFFGLRYDFCDALISFFGIQKEVEDLVVDNVQNFDSLSVGGKVPIKFVNPWG